MRTRIVSLGIAGVAAAGLLAGCGGEEEPAAAPPAEKAPGSPAAAPEQSAPAAGAVPAGATKPGTELKVGERAVVPYETPGGDPARDTIALTVTAVESIDRALSVRVLGSEDRAEKHDLYFIRYTVENVGGTDLSQAMRPELKAVVPGGADADTVKSVRVHMQACPPARMGRTFKQAGAKVQACQLRAVDKGRQVTGASYGSNLDGYRNDPIIWTK